MNGKFVCSLALFAIIAAMTFYKADACRRCGCDPCSYQQASVVALPAPPPPIHYQSLCHGCGNQCPAPSFLPRPYCGNCLRRKTCRLNTHCDCC